MSGRFLVWRLCDGYANASTFDAYGFEDAACKAHNGDFEYDDEEAFCVQAQVGYDRKVRVVTTERELVPEYSGHQITVARLKARCACGARIFDSEGIGRQCRRCWIQTQVEDMERIAKSREVES